MHLSVQGAQDPASLCAHPHAPTSPDAVTAGQDWAVLPPPAHAACCRCAQWAPSRPAASHPLWMSLTEIYSDLVRSLTSDSLWQALTLTLCSALCDTLLRSAEPCWQPLLAVASCQPIVASMLAIILREPSAQVPALPACSLARSAPCSVCGIGRRFAFKAM